MARVEPTFEFQIRLTLFTVHGLIDQQYMCTVKARTHADMDAYSDDVVEAVVDMRDSRQLPGDWSTGGILVEVMIDQFYHPSRFIAPRKGKLSIFD